MHLGRFRSARSPLDTQLTVCRASWAPPHTQEIPGWACRRGRSSLPPPHTREPALAAVSFSVRGSDPTPATRGRPLGGLATHPAPLLGLRADVALGWPRLAPSVMSVRVSSPLSVATVSLPKIAPILRGARRVSSALCELAPHSSPRFGLGASLHGTGNRPDQQPKRLTPLALLLLLIPRRRRRTTTRVRPYGGTGARCPVRRFRS